MDEENLVPRSRVRVMQIITLALAMGVATFLGVALLIVYGGDQVQNPPAVPILSYVAALFGASNFFLAWLMPGIIRRNGLKNLAKEPADRARDVDRLLGVNQTSLLIGQALIEGSAFMALVAFLVEKQPLALAVGVLGLIFLLLSLPRHERVQTWVGDQLVELEDIRSRGEA